MTAKNETTAPTPLGKFLKELREKKGVSLQDLENATGISNAYISQLETGARKKLPEPERLRKIADYYNVTVQEMLEGAGYYESKDIGETFEQKIEKAFVHVLNDPGFKYGTRVKGKYDLEAKRFIIEMYEKITRKKLL